LLAREKPSPRPLRSQRSFRSTALTEARSLLPTTRVHPEDMCQVTGRLPRRKNQCDGSPGVRDLAAAIPRYSVRPAIDLQDLLAAVVANVCLGNGDVHGKNFALLYSASGTATMRSRSPPPTCNDWRPTGVASAKVRSTIEPVTTTLQ
jgi:hypothetical protein